MIAQFWADIELARMILSWACFLFGGLAVVSGATELPSHHIAPAESTVA